MQWYRTGDPLSRSHRPDGEIESWVQSHKNYECVECLIWPFSYYSNGYGHYRFDEEILAHRVMAKIAIGPPPFEKAIVRHICGNGKLGCVNPKHLLWGTYSENEFDKIAQGKSHRGEKQWNSKLTKEKVYEIRKLLKDQKLSFSKIGKLYGVSIGAIQAIKENTTWAWLPEEVEE